jgi:hypothetical protein
MAKIEPDFEGLRNILDKVEDTATVVVDVLNAVFEQVENALNKADDMIDAAEAKYTAKAGTESNKPTDASKREDVAKYYEDQTYPNIAKQVRERMSQDDVNKMWDKLDAKNKTKTAPKAGKGEDVLNGLLTVKNTKTWKDFTDRVNKAVAEAQDTSNKD